MRGGKKKRKRGWKKKMRLIDADKLKEELKVNGLGYQYYMLDNAPTVDAIPVAFIEEQMRRYEELAYNSIPKIQQRYFDKEAALKSLINNWREKNGEKENG